MTKPKDALTEAVVAAVEGQNFLEGLFDRIGGEADYFTGTGSSPGVLGEWHERFDAGLKDGSITLCEHLSTDPKRRQITAEAQLMTWLVYLPDTIRCMRCLAEALESINKTSADEICDRCGASNPQLHLYNAQLPAGIMQNGKAIGVLNIQGAVCPTCHAAETELIQASSVYRERRDRKEQ